MTLKLILIFLSGGLVGAGLGYHYLYSPKAMIKNLWKEISKINQFRADPDKDSVMAYLVNKSPDDAINKRKEIINVLFNYLDPEKDSEFIKQYRAINKD